MKYILSLIILFTSLLTGGFFGFSYALQVEAARQTTAFYEGMYYGCLETASQIAGVPMFSEGATFTQISVTCGQQINQAMQDEVHRHWVR